MTNSSTKSAFNKMKLFTKNGNKIVIIVTYLNKLSWITKIIIIIKSTNDKLKLKAHVKCEYIWYEYSWNKIKN